MSNIKLAISNIAWDKSNDGKIYEYLKQNNIKGLEIAPTRIFEQNPYDKLEEAKEYANVLKEKYNLDIISMQSIWYGKTQNIFENEDNAEKLIEYTKKTIDFANAMQCTNLVFGCPKNRNISDYSKDYPKAINFFKEIGNYALNNKVIVSVEPNPVIYNTNFLNYTEQAINFVKDINLDSIKVNYDLGTVIYNKENLKTLEDNIRYINHIHISEPNLELIQVREMHKELINILKKSNYQKYVSIEMKNSNNIDNVKKIINYLNNIL